MRGFDQMVPPCTTNRFLIFTDCAVGGKVLILKDGILRKAESPKQPEPWTITIVHTNRTIRITRGTESERINVRRLELFFERNK
jgi:hypothetical protein